MGLFKTLFKAPPNVAALQSNLKGLIKALHYKDDKEIRIEAAHALGALGNADAIVPLIAALEDLQIRDTAVVVLSQFGSAAVEPLITALHHPSESVRLHAMQALNLIADEKALDALLGNLKHPKPKMREQAIKSLGFSHDEKVVRAFIDALHDVDGVVREAAVIALGDTRHPLAVDALLGVLEGNEQVLKGQAVRSLGRIGDPHAIEPLMIVYKNNMVRADIVLRVLGELGDGRVIPLLLDGLHDTRTRQTAQEAFNHLPLAALQGLIDHLGTTDREGKLLIIKALGRLGDEQALPSLMTLFANEDHDLRTEAATAFGMIGGDHAITLLEKALKSEHTAIRWSATWALWHSINPAALELLIDAAQDQNADVREVAVVGLRSKHDNRVIQPLIGRLCDDDENVRQSAMKALVTLGTLSALPLIAVLETSDDPLLRMEAERTLQLISNHNYGQDSVLWREWLTNS